MKNDPPKISTEELVVALLQQISAQLSQPKNRFIPIHGFFSNGKLGQLPGVVDDTINAGDRYKPDLAAIQLRYSESSGDVWIYEQGTLATIVPGNGVGNLVIDPGYKLVLEPEEAAPRATEPTEPTVSDTSAEELARNLLASA